MDPAQAKEFISRRRAATLILTAKELTALCRDVAEHAFAGVGLAATRAPSRPALDRILRSHALIHAAEGVFYRDVLTEAAAKSGVAVVAIDRNAASDLLVTARDLRDMLDEMGKEAGPPWTMDEKLASVAALALLPAAKRRFHLEELEIGA